MLSDLGHDYNSDFVIDPSEVDIRLSKIKIHKAPGPDRIPNWLLRDFSQLLCHPLAAIFSASIREGFFPPIWKAADVVAILKVRPPTSIRNDLRPISLLPTAAKSSGRHCERLAGASTRFNLGSKPVWLSSRQVHNARISCSFA